MADFQQDAHALLTSVLTDFRQFDPAAAVDWLCGFQTRVKKLLDATDTIPSPPETPYPANIGAYEAMDMPNFVTGALTMRLNVAGHATIELAECLVIPLCGKSPMKHICLGTKGDSVTLLWDQEGEDKEVLCIIGSDATPTRFLTFPDFASVATYILCDWWDPSVYSNLGEVHGHLTMAEALGHHLSTTKINHSQFDTIAKALGREGYKIGIRKTEYQVTCVKNEVTISCD